MARATAKSEKQAKESAAAAGEGAHPARREAAGIALLALGLFVALAVGSLQFGAGRLMGPAGAFVGTCAYGVLGIGAYGVAALLMALAVTLLRNRAPSLRVWPTVALAFGFFFAAVLLHLATSGYRLRTYSTGGLIGEYGAELMVACLGTAGTVLFGVTGLLLSTVLLTSLRAIRVARAARSLGGAAWGALAHAGRSVFARGEADADAVPAIAPLAETRRIAASDEQTAGAVEAPRRKRKADAAMQQDAAAAGGAASATSVAAAVVAASQQVAPAVALASETFAVPTSAGSEPTDPVAGPTATPGSERRRRRDAAAPDLLEAQTTDPHSLDAPVSPIEGDADRTEALLDAPTATAATTGATTASPAPAEPSTPPPTIVAPARTRPAIAERPAPPAPPPAKAPADYIRLGDGDFRLPDIELLDYQEVGQGELDRQAMLDLAVRLEKTLADYGVRGRVSEIHPGPVVTMYEFVPQAGTKLSKITALSNDLAMALEALKVRIVAPIPGKAAVGIEVPNRTRETVYLKEIIGSEPFSRARSKLAMALGKDIAGGSIVVDLAKMPHLLVAGTTGSGKSVSVNAMICSLLFNATPDEVKLIMIDPKMLELSIYEGIPHLLLPVVTDPKKANLALRWAVEEMERRYDLIAKSGVRDVATYNKKVEKQLEAQGERKKAVAVEKERDPASMLVTPRPIRIWVPGEGGQLCEVEVDASEEAVLAAGGAVTESIREEISASIAAAHKESQQLELELAVEPEQKLPYIVIIIDEFADLMMVASKEVEQSVARIAQKARAAGIHLMIATQRPSVDVITGLIKANFPSRIAFQVASKIDSRTILDTQGAESLLGMGDMLFTDRGLALKRVHGPLVTDGEIHKIVDFLKAQGQPVYDLDILKPRAEDEDGEGAAEEDESDEMYDQAVAIVSEMRQASTSMLQRRLRLGYNRAARMIERMERQGIVGPADGAKPREVLVRSHAA